MLQLTNTYLKQRYLLVILICFAFCCCQSGGNAHSKFAGMYKLYRIEARDSTGAWKESNWAKGGESYIIYDGLGHMAVEITPKGYGDFKWRKEDFTGDEAALDKYLDTMSVTELKNAVKEFSSNYVYVANCTIDEAAGIIDHNRIISTIPSNWGTVAKRQFSFSGDTLTLGVVNGNLVLRWIRQK